MSWSKEWKNDMLPLPYTEDEVNDKWKNSPEWIAKVDKKFEADLQAELDLAKIDGVTVSGPAWEIDADLSSGSDICIVSIELEDGTHQGQLVGDLVVYNNWGVWHVAHYPTQTRFDDAEKGAVPNGNWSKEQLLFWCDRVQCKHGQLWAILRELTPDTAHVKSETVLRAKDAIRSHCLSVNVER